MEHWLNWMISDVGAVLLLTPLLLLLNSQQRPLSQTRQHFAEFCIAVLITLATIVYLVGDTYSGNTGAAFLILVPLLWLAVRFSLAVAYPIFVGTIGIITAMSLSGSTILAQRASRLAIPIRADVAWFQYFNFVVRRGCYRTASGRDGTSGA